MASCHACLPLWVPPLLPWVRHWESSCDSKPSSTCHKSSFSFFFFSCVILHSLIFKKIFYWKTTAPDTHKHNGMSTSAGFSTCLPAFRHPSSSSSFPPSKCLFVFQGSKTNATFSMKVSSTSKIKLFAVSLFPFYTHLSSNTSQKY